MNEFSKLLKKFREEKKLSQKALAGIAGLDQSHLNRLERGVRNPPIKRTILALASALGLGKEDTVELLRAGGYAEENLEEDKQEVIPKSVLTYHSSVTIDDDEDETLDLVKNVIYDSELPLEKRKKIREDIRKFARWLHDEAKKEMSND